MVRALLVSLSLLLLPVLARADAVDFQVFGKVLAGKKDRPSISVTANEPVDDVEVALTRDDGKLFKHRTGKLKPDMTRSFPIAVEPGRTSHFKASMAVRVGSERQQAEFEFDAAIVAPAQLACDRVDLVAHTLELTSTRPTAKVEVEVTSDQGLVLGHAEIPFDNAAPGTRLPITWEQREGTVLRLAFRVHDPDGFYYGLELYPWRVEIPHEEVNFATNSSAIELAEQPKLDRSLELISESITRYGRWAAIKLYVAGHTDTVGSPQSNRALSLERARAISGYFRRKGLRVPIFYDGFGEQTLKVATPDETDELRNRRVDYVVAVEPPVQGQWKPLR